MIVLSEPKNRSQDVLRKNRNPERQYIFDKVSIFRLLNSSKV